MSATPPLIVNLPADNTIARVGKPLCIVAHDTEGVDSRNTLQHGDGRGVSVHFLVQKFPRHNGSTDVAPGLPPKTSGVVIYRMVPDERGANHAGFSTWGNYSPAPGHTNVNAVSLGFELECLGSIDLSDHYTDDQLLAAGYLINTWRAKFGPLPLVRHAEIDPLRRKDTFHLSTADLEKWANAAALVYQAPPPSHTVTAGPYGAIARTDYRAPAPAAAYFPPGAVIEIDSFFQNGYRHCVSQIGFIADGDLVGVA